VEANPLRDLDFGGDHTVDLDARRFQGLDNHGHVSVDQRCHCSNGKVLPGERNIVAIASRKSEKSRPEPWNVRVAGPESHG
jgi:hypothetical protein